LYKLAIDKNNLVAFEYPLPKGPVEDFDPTIKLPALLESAMLCESLDFMRKLQEIDIGVDGDENTHPLSAAVPSGSIDAVRVLLEWGATLGKKNRKSIVKEYTQTTITIAVSSGDVEMVQYLVSAGALTREPNPRHDALRIALADRRSDMALLLLQNGIKLAENDPLLGKVLEAAVEQNNVTLAKLMLNAGADPNTEEHYLHASCPNEAPTSCGTLFQWKCMNGNITMVQLFFEHGVDFDRPKNSWLNWRYDKPILIAWSFNNHEVVRIILGYYKEDDRVQIAYSAVETGRFAIVELCMEYEAVRSQSSGLMKKCMSRLNSMSSEKTFPSLTGTGYAKTIKTLIEEGACLPPDQTWHLSSVVLFWQGYKSLQDFLADCTTKENFHQSLRAEEVDKRNEIHEARKRLVSCQDLLSPAMSSALNKVLEYHNVR
jgi:ankyrin repeat protein